jgi:hypothetical protein
MNRTVSNVLRGFGALLLVVLAFTGISGGIQQLDSMHTTEQQIQTVLQFVFGVFSILALMVAFRASRFRRVAFLGFIISLTLAAGLAVTAWGGLGLGAALAAYASTAVIAYIIVWLVRAGAGTWRARPRGPGPGPGTGTGAGVGRGPGQSR